MLLVTGQRAEQVRSGDISEETLGADAATDSDSDSGGNDESAGREVKNVCCFGNKLQSGK